MNQDKQEKKIKNNWYCWYCGKPVGKDIMLWSLNNRIDRVFIVCSKEKCRENTKFGNEDGMFILNVKSY